jgi:putative ABC transport system permease protein
MNLTNLKIMLRSARKQKLTSILSILVLTLGMTSFMLIFFFIQYDKSYDESWNESNRIYRVALEKTLPNGNATTSATNYTALSRVVANEIPGIEYATGLWKDVITAYTPDNFLQNVNFFWGDDSFFKVFNQPFIAGNPNDPFPAIQSAVISKSAALRLFGQKDPLNKRFKINEGWEFIVAGVFADLPENSHLKIDILMSSKSLSYYIRHFDNKTSTLRLDDVANVSEPDPSSEWLWKDPDKYTYIRLKSNADLASVTQNFNAINEKYLHHSTVLGVKSKFILQPVASIHSGSNLSNELSPNSDPKTITALYVIAILILVMSWIIFINFRITQSLERAKEAGIRKVVGATSADLLWQIVLESVIFNGLSILLAFGVFFNLRIQLSNYLELNSLIQVKPIYLLEFLAVFAMGAILSGVYPAYITVTKKAQLLISRKFIQNNNGMFNLRRSLIVFQFAASIGLLIATSVIIKQVTFMKNKETGISIVQTVYSYTPMSMIQKMGANQKLIAFMDEINHLSGIKASTVSSCIPGREINFHSNTIYPMGKPEKKGDNFGIQCIDYQFQKVFNPKILAGRMFIREDRTGGTQLVINREACKTLGFDSPEIAIGKFVQVSVNDYLFISEVPYQICGVVEDFHQESPRKKIEPLLFINDYRWRYDVGFITVSLNSGERGYKQVLASLKDKWKAFYPIDPFEFKFTNETYQLQLKSDKKLAEIFCLYTFLSILLAALGLFGLAANSAKKRTKEIGIRKINGATWLEILIMLNKDFVKWVALAFAIAAPIAWYAMLKWLENFAYKTELSWWIFALSGLLALGIAMLTVSWQSWKAATRNPVEALKYE